MKNVLVSGGSRGIGRAVVKLLCESGCRVAFLYEKNEAAAGELAACTGAVPIKCDVSERGQVFRAYENAKKAIGHIDGVVSCAGIAQQALFQDVTEGDWNRMIGVNLSGAAYLAQAALPDMISEKKGAIVFVSSVWGEVGASMEAHYSASKAGLIGLMRALSKEVGPSGIRVNAIACGAIDTPMNAWMEPEEHEALLEEIPAGRMGTSDEVAQLVTSILQSPPYLTGQVITLDGGWQ